MKKTLEEVLREPVGTVVHGLAPIGIPWKGEVANRRATRPARGYVQYIKPDKGCPVGEFAPTHMYDGNIRIDIVPALEWWQGRVGASQNWDLAELNARLQKRHPGAPAITGVSRRVLFAPLRGVYLCEGQPSMWLEHLDYEAEFQDADPEWDGWDSVREYADDLLMEEPDDDFGYYIHTRSVWSVDTNKPLEGEWMRAVSMGTFDSDEGDGDSGQGFYWAREYAQGNHHV